MCEPASSGSGRASDPRRRPVPNAGVTGPPAVLVRTPRLDLRPLAESDLAALHAISTDPVVRRFLWDDRVVTREECAELLAESRRRFEESGVGLFGITLRGSAPLLGYAGLWPMGEPPVLELLYAIHPEHGGRGLATEAARAVMAYGTRKLGLADFHATVDAPNVASVRLLERLGFTADPGDGEQALRHFRRPAGGTDDASVECLGP